MPFSRYLPEIGRAVLFYGAANAGVKAIVKKRKDRVAFLTCGWLEFAGKYALQEGVRVCADAAHCPWALPADVRLGPPRLILELKPEAPFATKAITGIK